MDERTIIWKNYLGALIPDAPPHREVHPDKQEIKALLEQYRPYFIRYTDQWDRDGGEFWYVIKDDKEDLASYSSKMRNQIRKGLKHCRVERVSKEYIAENAYPVYRKAFERYDTFIGMSSAKEFYENIGRQDNREYWGFLSGKGLSLMRKISSGRMPVGIPRSSLIRITLSSIQLTHFFLR